ncbi:methyltransferase domain-containing protein [Kitasatospora sp. GP82]|uniref:methyltransferase domain-containing protein n=1 Tax=Kitasatospora sp. GP82 TaxID=3035089 RepID=UPI0024753252|nr:methyltransferase domain-containing protein [Kitasatospora sp. GP82]
MSAADELIHDHIAETAAIPADGRVIDLGCGRGPTLAAFARRYLGARLTGLDRSAVSVEAARNLLAGRAGGVEIEVVDLGKPTPLPDRCADAVVSYNLLECLPEPAALLAEAWRLLKPGGRAVIAHVDFDSIVIAGADRELDRRICHAFTDDQQPWMDHADGRIGRKLPGLVNSSPLTLERAHPWGTSSTELTGPAARRVENIRHVLTGAVRNGRTSVEVDEIEAWYAKIEEAAECGHFFFAETALVVSALC